MNESMDDHIGLIIAGPSGEDRDPLIVNWVFDTPTLVLRGPWHDEYAELLSSMERPVLSLNVSLGFISDDLSFLSDIKPPLRALQMARGSGKPEDELRIPADATSAIEEVDINADLAEVPSDEPSDWESLVSLAARYSRGLEWILRGARNLRSAGIIEIPNAAALRELCASMPPSLEELKIGGSSFRDLSGIEEWHGASDALEIADCRSLKTLAPLDKATLRKQLSRLTLSGCSRLQDISAISDLPWLTELQLDNCRNIRTIGRALKAPRLRRLVISGCTRIGDRDLSPILKSHSLRELVIEHYPEDSVPSANELAEEAPPTLHVEIG